VILRAAAIGDNANITVTGGWLRLPQLATPVSR
jgi:hypothetical protein